MLREATGLLQYNISGFSFLTSHRALEVKKEKPEIQHLEARKNFLKIRYRNQFQKPSHSTGGVTDQFYSSNRDVDERYALRELSTVGKTSPELRTGSAQPCPLLITLALW